jgi:hypothetical protein
MSTDVVGARFCELGPAGTYVKLLYSRVVLFRKDADLLENIGDRALIEGVRFRPARQDMRSCARFSGTS